MPLTGLAKEYLDSIEGYQECYSGCIVTYVAKKVSGGLKVIKARLVFSVTSENTQSRVIETDIIRAERFDFETLNVSLEDFIEKIQIGKLITPKEEIDFDFSQEGKPSISWLPFHPDALSNDSRLNMLIIEGNHIEQGDDLHSLDWKLKGADEPYESLHAVLIDFNLEAVLDRVRFDAIAYGLIEVARDGIIENGIAFLGVRAATRINHEDVKLGYIITKDGKVVQRGAVNGCDMRWEQDNLVQVGKCEINVPNGAIARCFSSYKGVVFNQYWIGPKVVPNARRAAYETFDPALNDTQRLLFPTDRRPKSTNLEEGVTRVLWMMGYNSLHIGDISEAPDIIVTTPAGHMLVVECTTGALKAENKLANLVTRTENLIDNLIASGNSHLKVIPVIVTTQTRLAVRPDLEQAERAGVLVVTREQLMPVVTHTIMPPDADSSFKEVEEEIAMRKARYPMLAMTE